MMTSNKIIEKKSIREKAEKNTRNEVRKKNTKIVASKLKMLCNACTGRMCINIFFA